MIVDTENIPDIYCGRTEIIEVRAGVNIVWEKTSSATTPTILTFVVSPSILTHTFHFGYSTVNALLIDWGDGSDTEMIGPTASGQSYYGSAISHTFPAAGTYQIRVNCRNGSLWTFGTDYIYDWLQNAWNPKGGIYSFLRSWHTETDIAIKGATSPELTAIDFGYGVRFDEPEGLYACTGLTEIAIPDDITNIAKDVFQSCTGIERVYVNTLTHWLQMTFASAGSSPLSAGRAELIVGGQPLPTSIRIPDGITDIGPGKFSHQSELESVDINGAATIGEQAFIGCESLETIDLQSVTRIGANAFDGCSSLVATQIGSPTVSISGENVFRACTSFRNITINTSSSLYLETTFYGCTALETASISCSSTFSMTGVFNYCSSLREVILDAPNMTQFSSYDRWYDCNSLESITLTAETPPSISGDFPSGIPATCIFYVPASAVSAYQTASQWSTRAAYIQPIP